MLSESTRIFDALLAARAAGLDVVPVSGRGRIQVRELCRLFGFPRGIGELGCLHVEGGDAHWEFGDFPLANTSPVDAMHEGGLLDLVMTLGDIEEHAPWNEGRHGTLLVRGHIDIEPAEAELAKRGFGWCHIIDNGLTRNDTARVYHLIPRGAGKSYGVAKDLARHNIPRENAVFVGDSRADMDCASEVRECWMVANGDSTLDWPNRTTASNADGVAELIYKLIE